jgi:hypothetical protein
LSEFRITTIKEKYGTLRIYTTHYLEKINDILTLAELESSMVCEVCGKWGKLRHLAWDRTLCRKHCIKSILNDNYFLTWWERLILFFKCIFH